MQWTSRLILGLVLLGMLGCSQDDITGPVPRANALSSSEEAMAASDEYRAMHDVQGRVMEQMSDALDDGLSEVELRTALLAGDYAEAYRLIGMSPAQVADLDDRYAAAAMTLKNTYPEIGTSRAAAPPSPAELAGRVDRILSIAQTYDSQADLLLPECLSSGDPSGQVRTPGCSRGGLVCAVACGVAASTVVAGILCGAVCICSFCEGYC